MRLVLETLVSHQCTIIERSLKEILKVHYSWSVLCAGIEGEGTEEGGGDRGGGKERRREERRGCLTGSRTSV